MVTHEVEPEAVELVRPGQGHDRIDHELAHHGVLRGGVRAAARGFDGARFRVEAVVVAGNDPVEVVRGLLPRTGGVVVDDVLDDAQAGGIQRGDHVPELVDPGGALRVGGVGAFRRRVVQRVVAPIEAVPGSDGGDALLLAVAVRCEGRKIAIRLGLEGAVLLDGADVVDGQQVHGIEPAVGELRQPLHAIAVLPCEGGICAAFRLRHRRVADREVPDVQLVHRELFGPVEGRFLQTGPVRRREGRVGEVHEQGALRIGRQSHAVGIGHEIVFHGAGFRHEDLDVVQVVRALPVLLAVDTPGAVLTLAEGADGDRFVHPVPEDLHGHAPRGRRPQREVWLLALPAQSQLTARGTRVQVVEHAGNLDAGSGQHDAVR